MQWAGLLRRLSQQCPQGPSARIEGERGLDLGPDGQRNREIALAVHEIEKHGWLGALLAH